MRAQTSNGLVVADARLRDDDLARGNVVRKALGASEIDAEVVEVAVVNSDHVDAKGSGAGDLLLGDGLGEDIEPKGIRQLFEFRVGVVIDDRHHEQNGVGAKIASGVDLNGVNDEVLAQHWQVRG